MRQLLCLLALGFFTYVSPAQSEPAKLRPGDQLRVVVFGYAQYSGDYVVLNDGSVVGVGFGRLVVSGRTVEDVSKEVTARLSKRLKNPPVEVLLVKQRPVVVYVVGAGASPGPVELAAGMDLRQLLGSVRLQEPPNRYSVTFSRRSEPPVTFDLEPLMRGDGSMPNPTLQADDVIAVLPKANMRVWVTGQVAKPGETSVEPGVDVYQAVSQAGGVISTLAAGGIASSTLDELRIIVQRGGALIANLPARQDPAQPSIRLSPGDVVVVQPPGMIRVTVSGEVLAPGEYVLREGASASAAIAMARGAHPEGSLKQVTIVRGGEAFMVDATGAGARNGGFTLKAGDAIFVPKNERVVYALGQVNVPGRYLIPDNQELDAAELLALARGLGPQGSLRRVTLIRPDESGRYVASQFNLDEFLKDGKSGSNPALKPGDILLFGTPRGLNLGSLAQVGQLASTAILIETLIGRR